MKQLTLKVTTQAGSTTRGFAVRHMINAGYVGRNRAAVAAHIDELVREGIAPPPSIPMLFPVLTQNVTTDNEIEVLGERTSGEVEYVLLIDGDETLVGIGSDHTDREMESHSIVYSKQLCPNVLSPEVWRLQDVKAAWDSMRMRSYVRKRIDDPQEVLYQDAALAAIIPPDELTALVAERFFDGKLPRGLVIFSGTVPVVAGEMIFGDCFRAELHCPSAQRTLTSAYSVNKLLYKP